jgi:hypothetical protein
MSNAVKNFSKHLKSLGACPEARKWASGRSAAEAWEMCDRADWMFWWARRSAINRRANYRACAIELARGVAHLNTDPRISAAIEAAERCTADPSKKNRSAAAAAAEEACAAREAAWTVNGIEAARAAVWAAMAASAAGIEAAALAASWSWRARARMNGQASTLCDIIRQTLKQPWSDNCE